MDIREIEWTLYVLDEDRKIILSSLEKIETQDEDETLEKEHANLLEDLHDVDCDIAMYNEMLHKMFPSEIGKCGFRCDGNCNTCKVESYDPYCEVFTGGDY